MKYTTVTDLRWADEAQTAINCTVDFELHGPTPFTATADDQYHHTREIHARALAGDFGAILPFIPPPAPSAAEIVQKISRQIDKRLLAWLKERRYDGPDSLGKYMNLSDEAIAALPAESQPVVTRYRAECRHAAAKVSQTWATAELILGRAEAGNWPTPGAAQVPTDITDIEGELPELEWPNA